MCRLISRIVRRWKICSPSRWQARAPAPHECIFWFRSAATSVWLLDLAGNNAKQSYDQRFRVMKPNAKAIQEALQDALGLPELPKRIECFDISHIQGAETVASMVVWEDGQMKKSDYRKFIIRDVTGVDDFASMREVVTRRYKRMQEEKKTMPSLVLIDGGLGQLHAAAEALEALEIINQPLAAIAKREEIIYVYGQENEPVALDHHSPVLHLVQTDPRRSAPLRCDVPSQAPPDARPLHRTAGNPRRGREHDPAIAAAFRQRAGDQAGGFSGAVIGGDAQPGGGDSGSLPKAGCLGAVAGTFTAGLAEDAEKISRLIAILGVSRPAVSTKLLLSS